MPHTPLHLRMTHLAFASGHTALNTPDPTRTRKLNSARSGQYYYWGGVGWGGVGWGTAWEILRVLLEFCVQHFLVLCRGEFWFGNL